MEKILTVVVPTYNMEKYLDKCLTSLIIDDEDTMNLLEVLVINDGSKDKSSEIAHSYELKYPKTFRVIDKENGNYGSCINAGLKIASGNYIKILDADDSFDNKGLISFLTEIKELTVDLILTNYILVDKEDREIQEKKFTIKNSLVLSIKNVQDMFQFNVLSMHGVTYKTKLLQECNYIQTEGVSYTDQEWILFPIAMCSDCYFVNITLYRYLIGREGQTIEGNLGVKNVQHHIKRLKKNLKERIVFDYTSEESKTYIKNRLVFSCQNVYRSYLILGYKFLKLGELVEFDDYLKRIDPEIYDVLSDLSINRIIKYHYIKAWRKNSQRKRPFALCAYTFIVDFLRFFLNIFRKG